MFSLIVLKWLHDQPQSGWLKGVQLYLQNMMQNF